MKFGFLLDKTKITFDGITISPLDKHDEIVKLVFEECPVADGWIFPPIETVPLNHEEKKLGIKTTAYKPSIPFLLPATHQITSSVVNEDEERFKFLILCYGFLHGIYLLKEEYKYLRKTPYKNAKTHSLVPSKKDLELGMSIFNNIYLDNSEKIRKNIFAVLHWFLISASYERLWDNFDAQYKVLDGVYRVAVNKGLVKSKNFHTQRPIVLAKKFGIIIPDWAKINPDTQKSTLSTLRNDLSHEALFAGEPIGYNHPKENLRLYFTNFNMKLICAVLDLNTPYLQSSPETRSMFGWDLSLTQVTPQE